MRSEERLAKNLLEIPPEVFRLGFLSFMASAEEQEWGRFFTKEQIDGFYDILNDFTVYMDNGGAEGGGQFTYGGQKFTIPERVTCKLCGKSFLKQGLTMHVMRMHYMGRDDYEQAVV